MIAVLGISGCSSGGGDDPAPQPPPNPNPPTNPPPNPPPNPPTNADVPPLVTPAVSIDDGRRIGAAYYPGGDTSVGGQGQTVAGIDCGTMVENYHVHAHVSLFLNGEQLALPGNIGIVPLTPTRNCFYNIHTHDASGKIHVEGPEPATYTLGQLFAIWGRPLEPMNTADQPGLPVVIYIIDEGDTEATKFEGDFASIELISHRQIVIQIGTELTQIPTYAWVGT